MDIVGDAPVERYVEALRIAADCDEADAVLFIHAPSAIVPATAIADACVPIVRAARRPVLSCWLGAQAVDEALRRFADAGIAGYRTPEEAVRAFVQGVTYRRNQAQLMEAPPSSQAAFEPDLAAARAVLREALDAGHDVLSDPQAKRLLAAYGIATVETREARSVEDAQAAGEAIGYPVALKILSPDISHKSDVGGVALDLDNAEELREAAGAMLRRVRRHVPAARIDGFTVQTMARRPRAQELIVGVATDALFGPVILFGHGGTAVEVIADRAVALPPLNEPLAKELVSRTRVARLLVGYRDRPPADAAAIHRVLVRVSQMVIDLPELAELDINPLLADENGVLALDARVRVQKAAGRGADRLAIRPYPRELEETLSWQNRTLLLRPIRPDDEARHLAFLEKLDLEDIRMRIFTIRRSIERSELARLTQIDYEREMAFVAIAQGADGEPETLGVVRAVTDPDNHGAELAIIVRSDLKGKGLGRLLLGKMIRYCLERGTHCLVADVLTANTGMLALARALGFEPVCGGDSDVIHIRRTLRAGELDAGV